VKTCLFRTQKWSQWCSV